VAHVTEAGGTVQQGMTDEQRKAVALEYFKRLDAGGDFFKLFAEDARVYFPKWGMANGRVEIEKLFGDVGATLSSIEHHYEYFNYVTNDDVVVVEGTSHGATAEGIEWRGGVTHAGRFCDVFEIRGGKIRRLSIYLDPDYAGADTDRYPWLEEGPSVTESGAQ
jgi:ketosteroid isomerase-like protein